MKKTLLPFFLAAATILSLPAFAQNDVYTVSSGELIFSQSNATFTESFMTQYKGAAVLHNPVRFTLFLHFGQYVHVDFSDRVGMFYGLALRNVGMITDESLPVLVSNTPGVAVAMQDYKIVRRQYTLGVPLALKIGSFKKGTYFFGGGEIEWAFVYKQKFWQSLSRDGDRTRSVDWFGSQTPAFLPSVFAGIQFPGGVNIRFKYYLVDFLNTSSGKTLNSTAGTPYNVSDLSRYAQTPLAYVSLCYQIRFDNKNKEN